MKNDKLNSSEIRIYPRINEEFWIKVLEAKHRQLDAFNVKK